MAIKFKNGTVAKAGDQVVGVDHCNRPCAGKAIKGSPAHGQDELVFQNDLHGAVQSSLSLTKFLRKDEENWKPSPPAAEAAPVIVAPESTAEEISEASTSQ